MRNSKLIVILILILLLSLTTAFADDRVSLGFLYGDTSDMSLVDRTNGGINQVAPTCLDIDSKGNLVVTANLTQSFVDAMHERNILVTPFLSNHWVRSKGRKALQNSDNLVLQIVETINKFNLDGVNVDIENLTEDDRDNLSNFVRLLKDNMPEGKILSVSVAANPTAKDYDWQGSYDYEALGNAADYIFVMAYDEHSIGGPEGPVASKEFTERSILYALNYVSKNKIVLGIPFYGRYWKEEVSEEGATTYVGGEAIVIGSVPYISKRHKGTDEYDEQIGEAKYSFSVNNEEKSSTINGNKLEDGNYIIWYSTNDSIKSKLELINEYDLLGGGVWALGQEKVEVWDYFKEELNKRIIYEEEIEVSDENEFEEEILFQSTRSELNFNPCLNDIEDMIEESLETININNIKLREEEPHIRNFVRKQEENSEEEEEMDSNKKVFYKKKESEFNIVHLHRKRMLKTY